MEGSHRVVGFHTGLNKFRVTFFKFILLHICIGERLGYADSCDTALQRAVDDRHGFPSSLKGFSHFLSCGHGNQEQNGNARKNDEGKSPINKSQIREGYHDRDRAYNEILRTVVRKLGNLLEITRHTGHNFAGFIGIKKGEGELFQVREEIASHLRLHPDTHDVPLVLDEKV